ncbi:MAG TPA: hypothetical protein VM661_05395 [Candidatus Sulfotelmatobacter sp.]|nr:hypothetical protein [Candidatus Sulfotelmatobacter sp.]
MSAPDFLVHDSSDNVGVAVLENAEAGQPLAGWGTDRGLSIQPLAVDQIPLGHREFVLIKLERNV